MLANQLLAFSLPDVILLCVLLLFFFIGVIRGFLRSLLSFFGTFSSIIVAGLLAAPFSRLLGNTFGLTAKFSSVFVGFLPKVSSVFSTDVSGLTANAITESVKLPGFIEKVLVKVAPSGTMPEGTTIAELTAPIFGGYLCTIISFIILYILCKVIILILSHLLNKIDKIKGINGVNKLFGGVFGLARGLLFSFTVLAVISFLPAKWMSKPVNAIQNSSITSAFYDNNLLVLAISGSLDGKSVQKLIKDTITK